MLRFFQVFFNQYSTVQEQAHTWYDWSKDFIWPIVIALVGAWVALKVFFNGVRVNQAAERARRDVELQDERNRKNQERNDKLLFFATILNNVINVADRQKKYMLEFIENTNKDQVTHHPFHKASLNEIRRVTNVIDTEQYLLSYTNFYSKDRKEAVTQFSNILGNVDFLHDIFVGQQEAINKGLDIYQRRINDFGSIQKQTDIFLRNFYLNPNSLPKALYLELKLLYDEYHKKCEENKSLYALFVDFLFEPLEKFCLKCFSSGVSITQELRQLYEFTLAGISEFNLLKLSHLNLAQYFQDQTSDIEGCINQLKTITNHLRKDFLDS